MEVGFRLPYMFLITLLCVGAFSYPSPGDSACRLNFTAHPYTPIGGCNNVQEKLKDWNGFPKTSCCQNALIVYSHALALQAYNSSAGNIFVPQDQWNDCSGSFRLQPNVSVRSCGFDGFFYGSGRCSTLLLSEIDQNVVDQCSRFGSSSFDDACGNCITTISQTLDKKLEDLGVEGNDTEEATCLVGLIVSVIASKMNDTSRIDDFDRCLPALAVPEAVNYIKIYYCLAKALLAAILFMIGLLVIFTVICITKIHKQEKKHQYKNISAAFSGLYMFSRAEIENAINYGNKKKCLGRGRAGHVYKGVLPSGQLVAIKHLHRSNTSDSFNRKIEDHSRVRHPNLVCLLGCCIEDSEQYLVYEYCSGGNLAQHLLKKDTDLTWELRIKILRDCAFALKYLHNHINDDFITHRDIKLTNVLLAHNMEPKLDLGLTKMLGAEESDKLRVIRGKTCYMYLEYMSNVELTSAAYIHSFGILILQLLSGRRVVELDLDASDHLTRQAKDVNMGKRPLTDFQDPRMKENVVNVDFASVLEIAVLCVAKSSKGRPDIDLVFEELDKAWKNTKLEMRARKEKSLLTTSPSKSLEPIHVR